MSCGDRMTWTASIVAQAVKAAIVCSNIGWPLIGAYCFGTLLPARWPAPAAGIKAMKREGIGEFLRGQTV